MSTENTITQEPPEAEVKNKLAGKLDAFGWGLFFVWIGFVLLRGIDFGVALFGVGLITLGEQAALRYFNLKTEGFWVVVGLLFLVGGVWEIAGIDLPFVPILLIVAGLVLLISMARGTRRIGKASK